MFVFEYRRPLSVREEIENRYLCEKPDAFAQQHVKYSRRNEHGQSCCEKQNDANSAVDHFAAEEEAFRDFKMERASFRTGIDCFAQMKSPSGLRQAQAISRAAAN